MSFDAGSIIARTEIDQSQFDRDLRDMEAKAQRFEHEPHRIKFVASFDQSDISRARKAFAVLDNQLSRDAAQRLRSGGTGSILGTLNSLFSTQQVAGAPTPQQASQQGLLGRMLRQLGGPGGGGGGGSLLGSLLGSAVGGRGAAQAAQAADAAAQRSLLASLSKHGNLLAGGIGGKVPSGPGGFLSGLAQGIGPNILGLGLKASGIVGLGGSLLGALPALTGGVGALGIGAVGLGAAGVLFKGANQQVAPLLQLQNQIQQAQLTATTPQQLQQLAAQKASLAQAVAALPAAQRAMFQAESQISNSWQNLTRSFAPVLAKGLGAAAKIFQSLMPLLRQFFAASTTLIGPVVRGLGDLARQVLPVLAQGFRIVAPLMRPFLDGIGKLAGGLLGGLNSLLRATKPALTVLEQILAMVGRDIGQMFRDFAPVVKQSATILKALAGVLASLFPIIGRLAAIFASTLAPVFKVFAGVIRQLEPVLTIIGKVIAELAGAILGDLAAAFGALAHLLRDIAPSLNILAKTLGQVFKVMENSGLFAVLGNALEKTVGPLAKLINALVGGLAPILPLVVQLISQLAESALSVLVTGIQVLVPIALQLLNDVFKPLIPTIRTLVPIIGDMARLFATGLGAVLRALAPILAKLAPWIFGIVLAIKAWTIVQGLLNIALDANPIGLIVIAIAALIIGVTALATHWHQVWTNIKNWAVDAWHFIDNDVIHPLVRAFQDVNTFFEAWVLRVSLLFAGWASNILGYAQDAFGWLPDWLPGAKSIKQGLASAQSALADFVSGTKSQLANLTGKTYALNFGVDLPPGVQGGSSFKNRRKFAGGTRGAPPGWAWTGEQGPELVHFGGGEAVLTHPQSMAVSRGFAAGAGMLTVHMSTPSLRAMAGLLGSAVNTIVSAVQKKVTVSAIGLPGAPVGAGGNVAKYAGLALLVLRMLGQPSGDLGTVLSQMTTESGGNPYAVNRTDINWLLGHPSVGLMQVIQGTFDAYAGPFRNVGPFLYGVSVNPLANIFAGVNYAINRYGASWTQVLGHGHGYDGGGWLLPGVTVAHNQTGMREAVITPAQSQAFTMLARVAEGMTARNDYLAKRQVAEVLNIMLPEGTSVAQAMSELTFRLRVAEQQGFAGVLP